MNMQREPAVEQYHGFTVVDPYRWLEDISSEETAAWIETQNEATQAYFSALPFADEIRKTLQANWDYPRNSVPEKRGNRFFFFHNSGLQQQSVLFMQRDTDSEPELLLDPNTLSADGTVALKGTFFSPDGTLLAYGLSQKGSDWHQLRIRHVDERKDSPETLCWLRSSTIAWHPDNTGFYYSERARKPPSFMPDSSPHFWEGAWQGALQSRGSCNFSLTSRLARLIHKIGL